MWRNGLLTSSVDTAAYTLDFNNSSLTLKHLGMIVEVLTRYGCVTVKNVNADDTNLLVLGAQLASIGATRETTPAPIPPSSV